jgi:hypothetical protein
MNVSPRRIDTTRVSTCALDALIGAHCSPTRKQMMEL